jgi:hypothetical protein
MVVGTNALVAYALEANGFIRDAPDTTLDFDMTLTALDTDDDRPTLWKVLKEADMTYSVNTERPFQARNAKAYEVEILSAPSRIGGQIAKDRPKPIPLTEQEWLLNGRGLIAWSACAMAKRLALWCLIRDGSHCKSFGSPTSHSETRRKRVRIASKAALSLTPYG